MHRSKGMGEASKVTSLTLVTVGVLEEDRATIGGKEVKEGQTLPLGRSKVYYKQNWTLGEGKTHNHHRD